MNKKTAKKNRKTTKTIFSFLLICTIFVFVIYSASDKEVIALDMSVSPYYYNNAATQNSQYYSVTFDEEGEAVVALKLNIYNPNNESLEFVKLEIPGENIRILSALQEFWPLVERCTQWNNFCLDDNCTKTYQKCTGNSKYRDYYPAYHTSEYSSEKLSSSESFKFSVPKNIFQGETATLIIYYKATGYVKKSMGVHGFDFESIKYNYDSSRVRVSINVQNGLFLQGLSSKVDYKPADYGMLADAGSAKALASIDSKQLSEYSRSIEYGYGFVKEASALDPWESFHVKGRYSASRLLLNKGKISLSIGIILLVIGLLISGLRKAYTALKNAGVSIANTKTSKGLSTASGAWQQALVVILVTSFVSSILLLFGWYALSFISKNLYSWFGYSSSGVLTLFLILIFFLYSLFVLLAPPVFVGIRFGIVHGFAAFGATICFLILNLIILAIIYASMSSGGYYY